MLFPLLAVGSVIILDNASFHKKEALRELALEYGFTVIFLPPYSPEHNPLEKFWAWMKRHLKKIIRNYDTLSRAIGGVFRLE